MATIDQLSDVDALEGGDEIAIYQKANTSTRKTDLQTLATAVNTLIQGEPDSTVYAMTMAGNSFTANALPAAPGASVWLQITLNITAPNGTINLPSVDDRANGQEVLVTCTQAVTALTLIGFGANVLGAPTSLTINGFFKLRYDLVTNCWYRVG